jgi:hypothetical protein
MSGEGINFLRLRAVFPHYARQKLLHSVAIACRSRQGRRSFGRSNGDCSVVRWNAFHQSISDTSGTSAVDGLGGNVSGNEESAGKRRITPGNRWLKRTLVQAAGAASHTKNSYLASQYRRPVGRRGKKRALIAVGHSILAILYYLLKEGSQYADLGADFFDRLEPERLTRYYVKTPRTSRSRRQSRTRVSA